MRGAPGLDYEVSQSNVRCLTANTSLPKVKQKIIDGKKVEASLLKYTVLTC